MRAFPHRKGSPSGRVGDRRCHRIRDRAAPEVDVNEIIVRPGRKHALITRSRLPERTVDRKGPHLSGPFVELPGIETDALPGILDSEQQFRYASFPFSPARYQRLCFRVLTASTLTIYCSGSQDSSGL